MKKGLAVLLVFGLLIGSIPAWATGTRSNLSGDAELVLPSGEEWDDEELANVEGENASVMLVYGVPGVGEAAAAATVAVVGGYAIYKAGSYLYERAKNWYEARRSSKKGVRELPIKKGKSTVGKVSLTTNWDRVANPNATG